ncbi:MAG TPA: ATP-binding cassette domain-containing protein [Solirubrobacteraceae bacterium]
MSHVVVNELAYAHPGGDLLFSDVSFKLRPGQHAALVGTNGVGKTTLLHILAGNLQPEDGEIQTGGRVATMAQDVGQEDGTTVRELLLSTAPRALRAAGTRLLDAERRLTAGDESAGVALGEAIGDWSSAGGYELEGQWDAACRRIVGQPLSDVGDRQSTQISGGERKRLVLDLLLAGDAEILLLDEPDNFLDVPAKHQLEQRIRSSPKTILLISHDRELLAGAVDTIVTLEGHGAWVHGGSYATYAEAREHRQQLLGDALQRWKDEERRLYRYFKLLKQRAKYSSDWAKKANAAETRWQRFVDQGPPPAPVTDQQIKVRLRGADSARRVVDFRKLSIDGLTEPLTDEIHFGERVGLIGPNGSGKTHLMRLLAGEHVDHSGELVLGPRVSPGLFTQLQSRTELKDAPVLDVVHDRTGNTERAMSALARYGLQDAARRSTSTLSGGQRARLEILCLELDGHNLLLLDEPTDNLDINSSEALEQALDGFEGTVIAVSHDRAFLKQLDHFLLLDHDGSITKIPDAGRAIDALLSLRTAAR